MTIVDDTRAGPDEPFVLEPDVPELRASGKRGGPVLCPLTVRRSAPADIDPVTVPIVLDDLVEAAEQGSQPAPVPALSAHEWARAVMVRAGINGDDGRWPTPTVIT